jgi:peptidoglycan/LPS O-acetylase OafA/YrhL
VRLVSRRSRERMSKSGLVDRPSVRDRSDSIDTLRAALALWVLTVHVAEWGPLSATGTAEPLSWFEHWTVRLFQQHGETHPAVIAFIVLSGYCIHRGGGRRGSRWTTAGYATKRFFRIWPVYVAASIVGAVVFEFVNQGHRQLVGAITETTAITAGHTGGSVQWSSRAR